MLDVINFPDGKMKECTLDELPPILIKKVKLHILDEEKPILCVLDKAFSTIGVFVITPIRVVRIHVRVEKGAIKSYASNDIHAEVPRSVLLSNFVGLDEVKFEKNEQKLIVRFNSSELHLLFHNEEVFYKFANTLLSAVNSLKYGMH